MSAITTATAHPEHNVTGVDFSDRRHFRYTGPPIIDIHAHVMLTRPTDPPTGPPPSTGPGATADQAGVMLEVGRDFQITRTYSMCYPDDIPVLRERFSDRLGFNGPISKQKKE